MKLSIFSRLIIGYLAIFILAMTVSIYAILQLRQLEEVTRSILFVDNRLVDYEKKLTDILLSMMRYERKFIIMKDEGIYNQFLLAKGDFSTQLEEIMAISDSGNVRDLLSRVDQLHKRYQFLFEEEVAYLRSGEQYRDEKYEEEKEYAIDGIMDALKSLRAYTQRSTYKKVNALSEADVNASKVAIVMGIVSLIFGLTISIFITINITKPLLTIKNKTREIAEGKFGRDLTLSSPPEIEELAKSFNSMCARLEAIEKMKSDFFSLMSHELRTPLTTIKEGTNLYIEGLEEGTATEKQKRLLNIINEECNRLINLVNSLLDLSKMEAGMMTYNFSKTDLAPLIMKTSDEMEPLAETKNIKLETEIGRELPHIDIDAERIMQALRNLVGNAVKFTPSDGNIRIYARSDDRGIKVSVSDTGCGISKEKNEAVFDKYHQAALANSGKVKGTGLGLSIVRQIINAHGGKVWVENTTEQGSTFSFVLPV
jgi:two-component system sensor histidine kinase GlrK